MYEFFFINTLYDTFCDIYREVYCLVLRMHSLSNLEVQLSRDKTSHPVLRYTRRDREL